MATTKKNRLTALFISICAIAALLAGATGVLAAKLQVIDIDIPNKVTLEPGTVESIEIAYCVEGDLPENMLQKAAKSVPLSWASSDPSVVTVDSHGKLTAVGPGTAEISVSGQGGALSDSCSVTVTITPEALNTLAELALTLNHLNVQNLGAALLPENTTAKVCYESSDETVATVSEAGEVNAVGRGECIIRAWAVDTLTGATYALQGETKVIVQAAPAKLSLNNVTIQPGSIKHLTVSTVPAEVDVGTDFIWTSSDESIASVDVTGTVAAKAAGTATITVSNELGQSASCKITVAKKMSADSDVYSGFVKGEPGVSASFLRSINAYYMMVPANIRTHFENNGGSATVSATSIGPRFGWGGTIKGLFFHETNTIWIDNREVGKGALLHEMGHYLEQELGFVAESGEFHSIYTNEVGTLRSVWSCSAANTASAHEYFAECFHVCLVRPDLMQKHCPQTYSFIMACANRL